MRKRMKKILAVLTAAVLCLSMSVTVFAAESPQDPDIQDPSQNTTQDEELPPFIYGAAIDENENEVLIAPSGEELSKEVEAVLKDEDKMKEVLESAGYKTTEDQQVVVLGAMDLEAVDEIPEGGIYVGLVLDWSNPALEGIQDGDTLYVLHQKSDGTWEVLEGIAVVDNEDGVTTYGVGFHVDSLSPVAVVKIMSNGEVVILDENDKQVGTIETNKENGPSVVKTTTVKTSPKTGN